MYLDTSDLQAYKNFMEGGYRCLREPMKVQKPADKFVPVYEYRWKADELPSAARNTLISRLNEEFPILQQGKSRAIGIKENVLDIFLHFSKVDAVVYLVSAHAYAVRRSKSEENAISEFINQLAAQLKVFG